QKKTFYNYMNNFNKSERGRLYNTKIKSDSIKRIDSILADMNEKNVAAKLMKIDCNRLLPNYFLMKTDRMTMAHSVEARVPYLDHPLIEFTAKIRTKLQLKNFNEKYLLRKSASVLLPKEIFIRPKHGFNVPIKKWFEDGLVDIARQL
ncbi:MAG: hypothetical protein JSW41_05065, partial [Candidatus Aenigmatarchaeota archaeon]